MVNEQRLGELLTEPRMTKNDDNEPNYLRGLNKLIDEFMSEGYEVVEIGSYEGASTELFALKCKFVHSVDPYDLGDAIEQEGLDNLVRAEEFFKNRMKPYNNYAKIKKTSDDAVSMFADGSVDAVYFDGNHNKHSVIRDLNNWIPKIKKGGTISGHDYHSTVKEAIDSVLTGITVFEDSSWAKKV